MASDSSLFWGESLARREIFAPRPAAGCPRGLVLPALRVLRGLKLSLPWLAAVLMLPPYAAAVMANKGLYARNCFSDNFAKGEGRDQAGPEGGPAQRQLLSQLMRHISAD